MALYAQHGHGKSDKLEAALEEDSIDGIIFAARNEKPENLVSYIDQLRRQYKAEMLIDPQFYVCTIAPPNDRYLPKYKYYEPGRTAGSFVGARRVAEYAEDTLKQQIDLGVDRLISPSVILDTFTDRWSQIALNLADASLDYHASLKKAPPLLLSFIVSEHALNSIRELKVFLDQVTAWDLDGVYLIAARDEGRYTQEFDASRLSRLLYMVYVLSEINGFDVICGYSDFVGVLLSAVGAQAFATGWSQSLRRFHRSSFVRRPSGGRAPRLRYSSAPLFNSILLSELELIADVGELDYP